MNYYLTPTEIAEALNLTQLRKHSPGGMYLLSESDLVPYGIERAINEGAIELSNNRRSTPGQESSQQQASENPETPEEQPADDPETPEDQPSEDPENNEEQTPEEQDPEGEPAAASDEEEQTNEEED